jgi:glycosyltransferase involved in cell wall biosynthesis
LSAGGLEYRKGIDVLIEALALLDADFAPHTIIAGAGPLKAALLAQARQAGIASRVEFIGHYPDLPALFGDADVFVSSSRWEGCPMVILEAMAAGAPIVATAAGGVPELVENGTSGLVVPTENPRALADALSCLLTQRELAAQFGRAAQERCQVEFRAHDKATALGAIYQAVLNQESSPARTYPTRQSAFE